MRIVIPCQDHNFALGVKSGIINGATATFSHYKSAFEFYGHECILKEYIDQLPDSDVYFVQSEWYETQKEFYTEKRKQGAKVICWLGHFIGGVYFDPTKIEADLFITTWQGDVIDDFEEKTNQKVHYIPHAYGNDSGGVKNGGGIVFAGNTYALRDEGIIDGVNVTRLNGILPQDLPAYYRGAKICLNFHGEFQNGTVSTAPSRIAVESGYALNERTFQVSGAGGFQLARYHPLLKQVMRGTVPMFQTNEELKEMIAYYLEHEEERELMSRRAQEIVLQHHTYNHRAKKICQLIKTLS